MNQLEEVAIVQLKPDEEQEVANEVDDVNQRVVNQHQVNQHHVNQHQVNQQDENSQQIAIVNAQEVNQQDENSQQIAIVNAQEVNQQDSNSQDGNQQEDVIMVVMGGDEAEGEGGTTATVVTGININSAGIGEILKIIL